MDWKSQNGKDSANQHLIGKINDLKLPVSAVSLASEDIWLKLSYQQEAPVKHHCWKKTACAESFKFGKHIRLAQREMA